MPEFFFTVSPREYGSRARMPGGKVMISACAFWRKGRFRVLRPGKPIQKLAIDSGGFTALKRWGEYPFTPRQYAGWVRAFSEDLPLAFVTVMDYVCERGRVNQDRIKRTISNTMRCFEADPDLPWLPVIQGGTLEEYLTCAEMLEKEELLRPLMGVGSLVGRPPSEISGILLALGIALPGIRFHAFGLSLHAITPKTKALLASWDSASWMYGLGLHYRTRLVRREDESRTEHARRLAADYTIRVALRQMLPEQLPLFMGGSIAAYLP